MSRAWDLMPGDAFDRDGVRVTVLRPGEPHVDRFGRAMRRFWCRREDTGLEGWVEFGSGGVVREVR